MTFETEFETETTRRGWWRVDHEVPRSEIGGVRPWLGGTLRRPGVVSYAFRALSHLVLHTSLVSCQAWMLWVNADRAAKWPPVLPLLRS